MSENASSPLEGFHPLIRRWFEERFGEGFRELRRLGLPFLCATKTNASTEAAMTDRRYVRRSPYPYRSRRQVAWTTALGA